MVYCLNKKPASTRLDGLPGMELELSVCSVNGQPVWSLLTLLLKDFKTCETFHYNGEGRGGLSTKSKPRKSQPIILEGNKNSVYLHWDSWKYF